MTHDKFQNPLHELNNDITRLILKFGRGRTLLAILRSYFRLKSRPPDLASLNDYLRKDIGLPEERPRSTRHGGDARF